MATHDDKATPGDDDAAARRKRDKAPRRPRQDSHDETEPLSLAPAYLHKVLELIEAHPEYEHTTASMARYASISQRALQYRFKRHLETTPKAHLRTVRLERVRTDLLAASPGEVTADRIAQRWGFRHYGHFSTMYSQRFNERPAQALYRPPRPNGQVVASAAESGTPIPRQRQSVADTPESAGATPPPHAPSTEAPDGEQ
ncbi:helix-turn-helix domain-containing protein [Phytoactinopolyspora halotolerans]|uniref:AraC family transcriptional regulator n=1 Tax=Phytoactinopolyspora halotolerans TaxID=1981512 RepID=A0A6L9SHM8_9ACTN|nr:helix-turn-helix domain-containing protein [Phytoactinopolyspora halotolerans]NEE03932.1 AraC family transcriptional regulator [Phytoactinopolyspora halotolerans]